jgi:hypothetical protein
MNLKKLKSKSITFLGLFMIFSASAQSPEQVQQTMLKATRFMVEKVSNRGGYVWYYMPDFSRQWGEMEAYPTMIWVQSPGTVTMGNTFLDAWELTGNEYYYNAAEKAANALIWGQSAEGGWNYMIDFAGDRSMKKWYETIGKNGWRLEEFQHYYGNSTFDDGVTSGSARFLLRIYLEKLDPVYKPALEKAIDFMLESQYPLGGWPQRYPLRNDFSKKGFPDYSSYYTLNDDVTWDNIQFLIQCYVLLGQLRFLDPIMRAMNFYILAQDESGGWGQQIDMNLKAASARTYEPKALLPGATYQNVWLLMKFYEFTGDRKFLSPIPAALEWLEKTKLPPDHTAGGRYTHPTFVDPDTNEALYVHRKGSNVKYGTYYTDNTDDHLLSHYGGKTFLSLDFLKEEYHRVLALDKEEMLQNSPLEAGAKIGTGILKGLNEERRLRQRGQEESGVQEIVNSLDEQGRWLTRFAMISHPYSGDGKKQELTDEFASENVGDETDTSPYRNTGDQEYISTGLYIRNMSVLMEFLNKVKE